jgi:6-phosphogluconolactonase (cycloisomerase 2 family)
VPGALLLPSHDRSLLSCPVNPVSGVLEGCQRTSIGDSVNNYLPRAAGVAPSGRLAILGVSSSFATPFAGAYRVNASGLFEALDTPRVPLPSGFRSRRVVVHPTRRLVYLVGDESVCALRVGLSGELTAVPGFAVRPGALLAALVVHPGGGFAYAADFSAFDQQPGALSLLRIADDGALELRATYPMASLSRELPYTGALGIDRTGRYLVTDEVKVYSIDAQTGELALASTLAEGAVTLAAHPGADVIYMAHDVADSLGSEREIWTLKLDLDQGTLARIGSAATKSRHHGRYTILSVEPGGRFLYHTTTWGLSEGTEVWLHPIDSSGTLAPCDECITYSDYSYPSDLVLFRGPRE